MKIPHNIGLALYRLIAPLAVGLGRIGLLGALIKDWFKVRQNTDDQPLNLQIDVLYFCASTGELRKVLPVIRHLNDQNMPQEVGFFSPSGFVQSETLLPKSVKKSYTPIDLQKYIVTYFQKRRIKLVVIAANDIWPNTLTYLQKEGIPYGYVGCSLTGNTMLKRSFHQLATPLLNQAAFIAASDKITFEYLEDLGIQENVHLTGDPRIEEIFMTRVQKKLPQPLQRWISKAKTIVFSSTHKEDHVFLTPIIPRLHGLGYQIMIVPHDTDDDSIEVILQKVPDTVFSNRLQDGHSKTLIVNDWGLLQSIYPHASHVYVGGGFGNGVHNVTEALLCQGMVFIGSNHKKFNEVSEYLSKGLTIEVRDFHELIEGIEKVEIKPKNKLLNRIKLSHKGASSRCLDLIKSYI